MSGHSKWANIHVKKTAQDARRGKIFTRHARLIEIVARNGGDPDTNAALRTAIDNAKADSVPNANIERAIKKGTGESKGEAMGEVMYAAMGPGGTAYLIECLTDNKNRTLGNVKTIITKNGGRFAESASVAWMFEQKGIVGGSRAQKLSDAEELQLIDAGAEDIETNDGSITVTASRERWGRVHDLLMGWSFAIDVAGLKYIPKQTIEVDGETAKQVMTLIEALEKDDDISEVHTNAAIL